MPSEKPGARRTRAVGPTVASIWTWLPRRSSHGSTSQTARKKLIPGLDNKTCARLLFDITNTFQPGRVLRSTPSSRRGTPNSGHPTCWRRHVATQPPMDHLLPHRCCLVCVVLMPHCMVLRFRPDPVDIAHEIKSSSPHKTLKCSRPSDCSSTGLATPPCLLTTTSSHTSREAHEPACQQLNLCSGRAQHQISDHALNQVLHRERLPTSGSDCQGMLIDQRPKLALQRASCAPQ